MNCVKMGKFILRVNIAKFATENAEILKEDETVKKNSGKQPWKQEPFIPAQQQFDHSTGVNKSVLNGGASFADLFREKVHETGGASTSLGDDCGKTIWVSNDVKAFHYLHGTTLIGRTVDLMTLMKMDRILWEEGHEGIEIHYVGGLSLLLRFKGQEGATEFHLKHDVWKKWFSVLDMWEGKTLPYERVAWLNVYGVPLHLEDNKVLDNIAKQFGVPVQPAQLSIDDGDL
ncbi:hypothetical protein Hdeb2414_s0022g00617471 [Helianthus debilis subsp. tardiflorus]